MKHFLLFYTYADSFTARRAEFREEHLAFAWAAAERGELVLAGALVEPMDQGVLLFFGETARVASRFAEGDPYVRAGLIGSWTVREWNTTVGKDAAAPVTIGGANER